MKTAKQIFNERAREAWSDREDGVYFDALDEDSAIEAMESYATQSNGANADGALLGAFSKWYEDKYKFQISESAIKEFLATPPTHRVKRSS